MHEQRDVRRRKLGLLWNGRGRGRSGKHFDLVGALFGSPGLLRPNFQGPTWHGRSGVHTHMTNTRITDPEILEKRYPVILRRFSLRNGSGGKGKFKGGDGIVRQLLFRRPVTLSVITERRVFSPYGLKGLHEFYLNYYVFVTFKCCRLFFILKAAVQVCEERICCWEPAERPFIWDRKQQWASNRA